MLLSFLQRGMGISKDILLEIRRACYKARRIMNICETKSFLKEKNYKFLLKEKLLFVEFDEKQFNK